MNNFKKCEIIKDLIPLCSDGVCSETSKKLVEEHLEACEDCRKLFDICKSDVSAETVNEKEAVEKFAKKLKKKNFTKIAVVVSVVLAIVLGSAYLLFVPEYTVPYSDDILEAKIAVDNVLQVDINLDNYKTIESWDVYTSENEMDLYFCIVQDIPSKLFKDKDKSDNIWVINNGRCVSYKDDKMTNVYNETDTINNIYYVEIDPDEVHYMTDGISFANHKTTLVWSAEK